jgi:hypothetical protein
MTHRWLKEMVDNSEALELSHRKWNGQYHIMWACHIFCVEELVRRLKRERHLHRDETGWKENGEKRWIWTFRAEKYAVFIIRRSRGEAVQRILKQAWLMFQTTRRKDEMEEAKWKERMKEHQGLIVRRATGTASEQREALLIAKRMGKRGDEYFTFIERGQTRRIIPWNWRYGSVCWIAR